MSEKGGSRWLAVILSAIVSGIVGVGSGYAVNRLTEKPAALTYDITSIQAFPGQERVGIVAVRISNSGKKELENIDGTITLPDAEIREVVYQGLTPQTTNRDRSSVRFQLPFINPTEAFSVQLLVLPSTQVLSEPKVDLRARGAVGSPLERDKGTKSVFASIATAVVATLTAIPLVAVFLVRKEMRSVRDTISAFTVSASTDHSGDQRDVFAFVLGRHNLLEEANLLRQWPRELEYWSISDLLTERWLSAADQGRIRDGIKAFDELVQYAAIADSSICAIQLNAAKLSLALSDAETAKQ